MSVRFGAPPPSRKGEVLYPNRRFFGSSNPPGAAPMRWRNVWVPSRSRCVGWHGGQDGYTEILGHEDFCLPCVLKTLGMWVVCIIQDNGAPASRRFLGWEQQPKSVRRHPAGDERLPPDWVFASQL